MHSWTPLLVSHVVAAFLGVLLGAHQVWRRPHGDARHRALGRVWVVVMLWTAVTSFWIRQINDGAFSWLHVLSVVTLVTVTLGVVNARRGRIAAHRGNMIGSWLGAVGAMTAAVAVPERMVPTYAVARPGGALAFAVSVVLVTGVLVLAGGRLAAVVDGRDAVHRDAAGGIRRKFVEGSASARGVAAEEGVSAHPEHHPRKDHHDATHSSRGSRPGPRPHHRSLR